ncbi:MAG TPA: DUF2062 domain-containing protein [Vicinamibacterales bacterium]|jgi:uncharacterized protein (DUF2062 family)
MPLTLRQRCAHVLSSVEANAGSPHRTAAALALGVFLSFSPFLGFQILLGMGAAFLLRLSRVVVLIGLCANLPWIMVPWYAVTTAGAAALLGVAEDIDIRARVTELLNVSVYHPAFWGRTGELAAAFFWPFVIGPTTGAALLAVVAYAVSARVLVRRARCRPATTTSSTGLPGDAEQRAADRHVGDTQSARLQP